MALVNDRGSLLNEIGTADSSTGDIGRALAVRLEQITLDKVREVAVANAAANHPFITTGKTIRELPNAGFPDNDSALVIAAGPSVHRFDTAKMLKESGFGGTLIATESALAWCLRHDITPHLAITLDPHAKRIVRWFGDPDLKEEDIERDDYFDRQDMDPAFRKDSLRFNMSLKRLSINEKRTRISRIAVASSASSAVVSRIRESGMRAFWWNPIYDDPDPLPDSLTRHLYGINRLPCVNAGGNVGSACWVFAHSILEEEENRNAGNGLRLLRRYDVSRNAVLLR